MEDYSIEGGISDVIVKATVIQFENPTLEKGLLAFTMITHVSAGFDGAATETRSLRSGTPVGQQRPGAACARPRSSPMLRRQ